MRVSCTVLESFRLFIQQDWMLEQELVQTITGTLVPTEKMKIGQAFDRLIERPDRYRIDGGYHVGAYRFSESTMAPVFELIDRQGVFQAKAEQPYGEVTVVSKADHLRGAVLSEFKTRLDHSVDIEHYADSYQWRFMTDAFKPAMIRYHIFLLNVQAGAELTLRGIESFTLYPYPALSVDCKTLVEQFVNYVSVKGLAAILHERKASAQE